jgi:hypothetical protein
MVKSDDSGTIKFAMSIKKLLPESIKEPLRSVGEYFGWPLAAHKEFWRDAIVGLRDDPGAEKAIEAGLAWIGAAQDNSNTQDGGVARHYSLLKGWGASYPETTGYIIPTLLEQARLRNDDSLRERARRMLDWEVSIQLPDGAFQGSTRAVKQVVPVVFDTGQILQGLAAGVREFGEQYRQPMIGAAEWLVRVQDADGSWRVENPYAMDGDHTWDTHVAWGLLEAARVEPSRGYGEAALRNIRWAVTRQTKNGWFEDCCLHDSSQPLTHTIGYVLRGVVEGYLFSKDSALLEAAMRTSEALLKTIDSEGRMPGRFDRDWQPTVSWVCLTGSVQIAICWLLLHRETGNTAMRDAAFAVNKFVRRTVSMDGPPHIRGGVKGSFPVTGFYGRLQYLNWACKFMIDSSLLELQADTKRSS